MSDVVSFDGHPKLQQAQMLAQISERNNSALTVLASLGIETLEQFSRKSTAELHTVDSGVVKQLNEALVRQLWEILDTYVDAFKARVGERRPYSAHLRMKELTYRHQYADIQRMLGRFHKATVDTILKMSFPLSMWGPKEGNPIVYLVAAPRQGKSLMLTEVADRAAKRGFVGVPITFNNFTALKPENADSARGALSEFWGRVVYALLVAMLPERTTLVEMDAEPPFCSFDNFSSLPWFTSINDSVVFTLADKLELERVVIAADEISRLTSYIKQWSNNKSNKTPAVTSIIASMYKNQTKTHASTV